MTAARTLHIETHPDVGSVFEVDRFEAANAHDVAAGFEPVGWFDLPSGGYRHWLHNGLQRVRIEGAAQENGDVGIQRHVAVLAGEIYRLTATVRLTAKSGRAKLRVNLAARAGRKQLQEFNARQKQVTDEPVTLTVEAVMPEGASVLTARVKLHTSQPGEECEGEIHRVKLERLA